MIKIRIVKSHISHICKFSTTARPVPKLGMVQPWGPLAPMYNLIPSNSLPLSQISCRDPPIYHANSSSHGTYLSGDSNILHSDGPN